MKRRKSRPRVFVEMVQLKLFQKPKLKRNEKMNVKVTVGKRGEERKELEFDVTLGEGVATAAREAVTEEQIQELALVPVHAAAVKKIRKLLAKNISAEKIQELMQEFVPGSEPTRRRIDPVEAAREKVQKLIDSIGREEALKMLGLA
jgi:hypothetical protein